MRLLQEQIDALESSLRFIEASFLPDELKSQYQALSQKGTVPLPGARISVESGCSPRGLYPFETEPRTSLGRTPTYFASQLSIQWPPTTIVLTAGTTRNREEALEDEPTGKGPTVRAGCVRCRIGPLVGGRRRNLGRGHQCAAGRPGGCIRIGAGSFEDFDLGNGFPKIDDVRKLFVQVPGEPCEFGEARKNDRPIVRISGVVRMNLSWTAANALRFSFLEANPLQVHIWSGARGITLRYYPEFHQCWVAYATSHESGKHRPNGYVLLATSEDRYWRSGLGTVELHCRDGALTMVRGDLEILTVPIDGPVSEVDFEGTALFRGLEVGPSKWKPEAGLGASVERNRGSPDFGRPEKEEPPKGKTPTGQKMSQPVAAMQWQVKPVDGKRPDGIALTRAAGGAVELSAKERTAQCQAAVLLNRGGWREFVFEIEDAQPGTGFFLGDHEGRHLAAPRVPSRPCDRQNHVRAYGPLVE